MIFGSFRQESLTPFRASTPTDASSYVQKSFLHYIENTGDTDLVFLEMFGKVDRFQDLSFSEWLAHTPPEAVMAHLRIDKATFAGIPKNGGVVMPLS